MYPLLQIFEKDHQFMLESLCTWTHCPVGIERSRDAIVLPKAAIKPVETMLMKRSELQLNVKFKPAHHSLYFSFPNLYFNHLSLYF